VLLGRRKGGELETFEFEFTWALGLVGTGVAPNVASYALGSYGGGSLRGVVTRPRISGRTDEVVDWYDSARADFETVIQSGSSLGRNGFDGRLGFGVAPLSGGRTVDLAGSPFSSHHLRRSEDAGGRPGSMGS
jgi:hypothetical protein